jgi:hypothetical protein
VFDRQAMERMVGIRKFGCDTKERAANYFGPVRILWDMIFSVPVARTPSA